MPIGFSHKLSNKTCPTFSEPCQVNQDHESISVSEVNLNYIYNTE
jgi:hypothetical protein